jgi:hypothetical protein
LENRIASALKCQSRYGIFQKYLHRTLLWQASEKMKEIEYDFHVPSWSWMACSGSIQFLDIPLGGVEWTNYLRFDEKCACDHAITTNLWTLQDCTVEAREGRYTILDLNGEERGWIQYDEDGEQLSEGLCVVIGRTHTSGAKECYILVVNPTSVKGEYRRIGVGLVQSDWVVGQRTNVRIV